MNIKADKLFFIISLFSIHLIPFAKFVSFETFPILLISFCIFIILMKEKNFTLLIKKNKLIFLFITFLIFIYLTDIPEGKRNEIELIKYLIGPIVFLSFPRIKKYFGINELILFGLFIISLFLIFKLQIPLLFQFSCNSLEFFIARLDCSNLVNLASAGVFLITPEPGYLSLLLSYYLIVLFFFKKQSYISSSKKIIIVFIELFVVFMIYYTSSRTGVLFLLFYLFFYLITYKFIRNIFIFLFFIFLLSFFLGIIGTNFVGLMDTKNTFLFKEFFIHSRTILNFDRIIDYYYNYRVNSHLTLFEVLNWAEVTGFIRFIHNYLAFKGAFSANLLGNGLGSYPEIWFDHAVEHNVDHLIRQNEVMGTWFPDIYSKKQYVQNYFFSIFHDAGLIPAIIFLIILFKSIKNTINSKKNFNYVILFYVFLTFFFQSTITSPYPWLALSLIFYNEKRYS